MSVFDPGFQEKDINSKIVSALERISESFRVALWNSGKDTGLSPIQIQILLFIRFHAPEFCKISLIAKEFNMTKATISDAANTLVRKKLLSKEPTKTDNRSHILTLSAAGLQMAAQVENYAEPLVRPLSSFSSLQKDAFFALLLQYLRHLTQEGTIGHHRDCLSCRHFKSQDQGFYCSHLDIPLSSGALRLDCVHFTSDK